MTTKELIVSWVSTQSPEAIADLLLLPKTQQKVVLAEFAAQQRQTRETTLANADANLEMVKSNLQRQISDLAEVESQLS